MAADKVESDEKIPEKEIILCPLLLKTFKLDAISQKILIDVLEVNDFDFVEFEGELYFKYEKEDNSRDNGHRRTKSMKYLYEMNIDKSYNKIKVLEQFVEVADAILKYDMDYKGNRSVEQIYIQKIIKILLYIQNGDLINYYYYNIGNANASFSLIKDQYLQIKLENENAELKKISVEGLEGD